MGIEVYRGSLDSQASSTGTMVEQQLKAHEALETSLTQIENSASRLSLPRLTTLLELCDKCCPAIEGGRGSFSGSYTRKCEKLPASYRSEVADEDLQEEKLVSDIEQCDRMITYLSCRDQ